MHGHFWGQDTSNIPPTPPMHAYPDFRFRFIPPWSAGCVDTTKLDAYE